MQNQLFLVMMHLNHMGNLAAQLAESTKQWALDVAANIPKKSSHRSLQALLKYHTSHRSASRRLLVTVIVSPVRLAQP